MKKLYLPKEGYTTSMYELSEIYIVNFVTGGSASSVAPPMNDYPNVQSFMHNPPSSAWNDPPLVKDKKPKVLNLPVLLYLRIIENVST